MVENIQTRLDKSEKKIRLMATTLQTLINSTPNENGEKYRNRGGEDEKRKKKNVEKHSSN